MNPPEVIFGVGALDQLGSAIERQGARRVVVIASRNRERVVERVQQLLHGKIAGWESTVTPQVPETLVSVALARIQAVDSDAMIAIGGGSAIGLAKAVALSGGPPILAVPTTYSGSEATSIWGITRRDHKDTGRDPRVLPRTIIYDPLLTLDLPPSVTGPSLFNAMAHCIEAAYAPKADATMKDSALAGFGILLTALEHLVDNPGAVSARTEAFRGSWLAGQALERSPMGLHHQICHILGGTYGLDHAGCHTVLLPYIVAFNQPAAESAVEALARAFSQATGSATQGSKLGSALWHLGQRLARGAALPRSLGQLGFEEKWIEHVAQAVVAAPYPNPRRAEMHEVTRLLARAHQGAPF